MTVIVCNRATRSNVKVVCQNSDPPEIMMIYLLDESSTLERA